MSITSVSLGPVDLTQLAPCLFMRFLLELIVFLVKWLVLQFTLSRIFIQIRTVCGKAALKYLISLDIWLVMAVQGARARSLPPKWSAIIFGGVHKRTWDSTDLLRPDQVSPPIPHQAIDAGSFRSGIPLSCALSPARRGIESPKIHMSEEYRFS